MYKKIIVGYDGSEHAEDALAFARGLSGAFGAELMLVEVMPYEPLLSEVSIGPPTTLTEQRASTREGLRKVGRSLDIQAEAVESVSPARGLHEAAEDFDADLIVVGSCHRGPVGRALAGSLGRRLLNGAPCAVAVAPRGYREGPKRAFDWIGVGYDGSPEAKLAVDTAARLAHRAGASLRAITAVPPLNYGYSGVWVVTDPDLERVRHQQAGEELEKAMVDLPYALHAEGRVVDGDPVRVLTGDECRDLDLLFVGSRGYGRLRGAMVGSVSADLIHSTPYPVIVVPRGIEVRKTAPPAATAAA